MLPFAGEIPPPAPTCQDPVLRALLLTNTRRELDKGTQSLLNTLGPLVGMFRKAAEEQMRLRAAGLLVFGAGLLRAFGGSCVSDFPVAALLEGAHNWNPETWAPLAAFIHRRWELKDYPYTEAYNPCCNRQHLLHTVGALILARRA